MTPASHVLRSRYSRSRSSRVRSRLRLPQRLDLRAREEIAIAGDDRGLLGDFLLPHANGARLLGALEVVLLEARLVLGGVADGGCRHALSLQRDARRAASLATVDSSSSIVNGLPSTAVAFVAASASRSVEPVTTATGIARSASSSSSTSPRSLPMMHVEQHDVDALGHLPRASSSEPASRTS